MRLRRSRSATRRAARSSGAECRLPGATRRDWVEGISAGTACRKFTASRSIHAAVDGAPRVWFSSGTSARAEDRAAGRRRSVDGRHRVQSSGSTKNCCRLRRPRRSRKAVLIEHSDTRRAASVDQPEGAVIVHWRRASSLRTASRRFAVWAAPRVSGVLRRLRGRSRNFDASVAVKPHARIALQAEARGSQDRQCHR